MRIFTAFSNMTFIVVKFDKYFKICFIINKANLNEIEVNTLLNLARGNI